MTSGGNGMRRAHHVRRFQADPFAVALSRPPTDFRVHPKSYIDMVAEYRNQRATSKRRICVHSRESAVPFFLALQAAQELLEPQIHANARKYTDGIDRPLVGSGLPSKTRF
jgi:hypothetical protein